MTNQEQAIAIINELISMDRRSPFAGQLAKAVDLLNQDEPVETQQVLSKPKKG